MSVVPVMMWVWVSTLRVRGLVGWSFRLPGRVLFRRVWARILVGSILALWLLTPVPCLVLVLWLMLRLILSDPRWMMWVWVLAGVSGWRWRLLGAPPRVWMRWSGRLPNTRDPAPPWLPLIRALLPTRLRPTPATLGVVLVLVGGCGIGGRIRCGLRPTRFWR